MGLAASQCRLLSLTSRLSDLELRAQSLSNQKVALASASSRASNNYINALNNQYVNIWNPDGTYSQATADTLTCFNAATGADQLFLQNDLGQVLCSKDMLNAYVNSLDAATGSCSLDKFLDNVGASTGKAESLALQQLATMGDDYAAITDLVSTVSMYNQALDPSAGLMTKFGNLKSAVGLGDEELADGYFWQSTILNTGSSVENSLKDIENVLRGRTAGNADAVAVLTSVEQMLTGKKVNEVKDDGTVTFTDEVATSEMTTKYNSYYYNINEIMNNTIANRYTVQLGENGGSIPQMNSTENVSVDALDFVVTSPNENNYKTFFENLESIIKANYEYGNNLDETAYNSMIKPAVELAKLAVTSNAIKQSQISEIDSAWDGLFTGGEKNGSLADEAVDWNQTVIDAYANNSKMYSKNDTFNMTQSSLANEFFAYFDALMTGTDETADKILKDYFVANETNTDGTYKTIKSVQTSVLKDNVTITDEDLTEIKKYYEVDSNNKIKMSGGQPVLKSGVTLTDEIKGIVGKYYNTDNDGNIRYTEAATLKDGVTLSDADKALIKQYYDVNDDGSIKVNNGVAASRNNALFKKYFELNDDGTIKLDGNDNPILKSGVTTTKTDFSYVGKFQQDGTDNSNTDNSVYFIFQENMKLVNDHCFGTDSSQWWDPKSSGDIAGAGSNLNDARLTRISLPGGLRPNDVSTSGNLAQYNDKKDHIFLYGAGKMTDSRVNWGKLTADYAQSAYYIGSSLKVNDPSLIAGQNSTATILATDETYNVLNDLNKLVNNESTMEQVNQTGMRFVADPSNPNSAPVVATMQITEGIQRIPGDNHKYVYHTDDAGNNVQLKDANGNPVAMQCEQITPYVAAHYEYDDDGGSTYVPEQKGVYQYYFEYNNRKYYVSNSDNTPTQYSMSMSYDDAKKESTMSSTLPTSNVNFVCTDKIMPETASFNQSDWLVTGSGHSHVYEEIQGKWYAYYEENGVRMYYAGADGNIYACNSESEIKTLYSGWSNQNGGSGSGENLDYWVPSKSFGTFTSSLKDEISAHYESSKAISFNYMPIDALSSTLDFTPLTDFDGNSLPSGSVMYYTDSNGNIVQMTQSEFANWSKDSTAGAKCHLLIPAKDSSGNNKSMTDYFGKDDYLYTLKDQFKKITYCGQEYWAWGGESGVDAATFYSANANAQSMMPPSVKSEFAITLYSYDYAETVEHDDEINSAYQSKYEKVYKEGWQSWVNTLTTSIEKAQKAFEAKRKEESDKLKAAIQGGTDADGNTKEGLKDLLISYVQNTKGLSEETVAALQTDINDLVRDFTDHDGNTVVFDSTTLGEFTTKLDLIFNKINGTKSTVQNLADADATDEALIKYYTNIFNAIERYGARSIDDKKWTDKEWLNEQLTIGNIHTSIGTNGYLEQKPYTSLDYLSIDNLNEELISKAQAEYEAEVNRISKKEKKIDRELSMIETEHTAIENKVEEIKTVQEKNVERSFNLFS
ncbi:hypothetical protein IJ732_06150 [bacterium]|nr:hypothetical protein [bacterium]